MDIQKQKEILNVLQKLKQEKENLAKQNMMLKQENEKLIYQNKLLISKIKENSSNDLSQFDSGIDFSNNQQNTMNRQVNPRSTNSPLGIDEDLQLYNHNVVNLETPVDQTQNLNNTNNLNSLNNQKKTKKKKKNKKVDLFDVFLVLVIIILLGVQVYLLAT